MKEKILNWLEKNLNSYTILLLLVFTIFIIPILSIERQEKLNPLLNLCIFLSVIFISPKNRKSLASIVIVIILLRWVAAPLINNPGFKIWTSLFSIIIFFYAVFQLVIEIALQKNVSKKVVIDAINGYLFLGLAFSFLVSYTSELFPGAYSFKEMEPTFSLYSYFSFVTLSTLGYGDIAPQLPISRSLAILTAVTGQLYMAIIIAMIVGKYATNSQKDT